MEQKPFLFREDASLDSSSSASYLSSSGRAQNCLTMAPSIRTSLLGSTSRCVIMGNVGVSTR